MAFIEGFKIMKVAFDADVKSPHFMYFKKHTQNKRNELFPADRTIFVVNVPPYCTKRGLENLFGLHGPIQSIFIQDGAGHVHDLSKDEMDFLHMQEHFSFKVGYVVFEKPNSIEKLMRMELSKIGYMSKKEKPVKSGLEKWCKDYMKQYLDPDRLQKGIDKFMAEFDQKKAKEKAELERLANEPDEEGWTVVTHGKKNLGPVGGRITKRERKKRQKKELANFYTFQQRETNREHIATLRKKFEDDKKKIEQLRASRKFKPF